MIPAPSFEFLLTLPVLFLGTVTGIYMAARRPQSEIVAGELETDGETDDMEQLDFADALEARNAVLDEVADNNSGWIKLAAAGMDQVRDGYSGIAEDFRRVLLERGVPQPKHPNAWGAFTATMARRGVLVATGEYRPMREARSNGRKSAVYVKQTPAAA